MKKNKVIHFGFLIIAFVFFSNPNVNIIDVLPDAIGCLLIAFAIGKLAYLCDRIRDAQSAFYTLFWITVSKIPALETSGTPFKKPRLSTGNVTKTAPFAAIFLRFL